MGTMIQDVHDCYTESNVQEKKVDFDAEYAAMELPQGGTLH